MEKGDSSSLEAFQLRFFWAMSVISISKVPKAGSRPNVPIEYRGGLNDLCWSLLTPAMFVLCLNKYIYLLFYLLHVLIFFSKITCIKTRYSFKDPSPLCSQNAQTLDTKKTALCGASLPSEEGAWKVIFFPAADGGDAGRFIWMWAWWCQDVFWIFGKQNVFLRTFTIPGTNTCHENRSSRQEPHLPTVLFRGLC